MPDQRTARWESVKSAGEVVYWRLVDPTGKSLGAVGHPRFHDGRYRALRYGKSTPSDNVELGHYATKRQAQRAVEPNSHGEGEA